MRRRRAEVDESSTRRSVRFVPRHRESSRDIHVHPYIHMLTEDLHLGVTPIFLSGTPKQVQVVMEPDEARVREVLRMAFPTHHGEPRDITEAICEFIQEVVQVVAYYGTAYYEIVYFFNRNDRTPTRFELERISHDNINAFLGFYWQHVPHRESASFSREESKRRFILLSRRDIVRFSIPKQLGGPRCQRRLLQRLIALGETTFPKFAIADMAPDNQQRIFDLSVYARNKDIYITRATRHLGWPVRSLIQEQTLELYQLYRYLRFERTKAILREAVLERLNNVLSRVGRTLSFSVALRLEGMPTSSELDRYISELIAGKLAFKKIPEIMKIVE